MLFSLKDNSPDIRTSRASGKGDSQTPPCGQNSELYSDYFLIPKKTGRLDGGRFGPAV